jgi:hypothetical protein
LVVAVAHLNQRLLVVLAVAHMQKLLPLPQMF